MPKTRGKYIDEILNELEALKSKPDSASTRLALDAPADSDRGSAAAVKRLARRMFAAAQLGRRFDLDSGDPSPALATPEHMLERKKTPPNLPDVVRGLLRKGELKDKVLEVTKKYKVGGKSYFYLWGLDDERASGLY